MSQAAFDPAVRDRDNLEGQDQHETSYAELGAILQRVRDLEKTMPQIAANENLYRKLGELRQIVQGMQSRYQQALARDRTPDS